MLKGLRPLTTGQSSRDTFGEWYSNETSQRLTMKKFISLFCLVVFIGKPSFVSLGIAAQSVEECKDVGVETPLVRLKNYLFCNYPWNENNTKSNSTVVGIEILLTFATMDEYENHLKLGNGMHVAWTDEYLVWDPAQFGNIRRVEVYTSNIWAPVISVRNLDAGQADDDLLMLGKRCYVNHKGQVLCSPKQRHRIPCENDFTLWPYDRHNCTLVFTSWPQMPSEITFVPFDDSNQSVSSCHNFLLVFVYDFVINGHWEIAVSRATYEQIRSKHFPTFKSSKFAVDFIVDRVHPQLAGRYVWPAILLTIMTLTTVSLDPGSKERLALGCLNPIIHLLSIEDLNYILPQNATTVPSIVLIYVNSFVLTIVALLFTIILTNLRASEHSLPKWISWTLSWVLRYRIGRIVLLGIGDRRGCSSIEERRANHDDDLVDFERAKNNWHYVVLLLNWIIILSFLLTYIVLWSIFLPNSSTKSAIVDVSERLVFDD